MGAKPLTILICFLIYGATGFLFTANNVLSQRVLGSYSNKGLMGFLYMLILAVLLTPGIIAGVFLLMMDLPAVIVGLPVVAWNIVISVIIYGLCRNLLSTAELAG